MSASADRTIAKTREEVAPLFEEPRVIVVEQGFSLAQAATVDVVGLGALKREHLGRPGAMPSDFHDVFTLGPWDRPPTDPATRLEPPERSSRRWQ